MRREADSGKDVVFKGGTALSKCFQVIERFSEDIDLVVLRRQEDSNNSLKTKLKAVSQVVETVMPEIKVDGITRKRGMNRKTAHTYTKEFSGNYGQVRDIVILESSWLGSSEPYEEESIVSFVGQMMLDNKQAEIAHEYELLPFNLQVLKPTRTICEKIMSLVRFSYGEEPIKDLKNKIRHAYDLHQLLSRDQFLSFFQSDDFDKMLIKVANDDVISYRNNKDWLKYHPSEALIFKNPKEVWPKLKPTYSNDFKSLVYGGLPAQDEILNTILMVKERLAKISWTIEIEK